MQQWLRGLQMASVCYTSCHSARSAWHINTPRCHLNRGDARVVPSDGMTGLRGLPCAVTVAVAAIAAMAYDPEMGQGLVGKKEYHS